MEAKKEYEKEEELIKSRIAPEERVEITKEVDSIKEANILWYELDQGDTLVGREYVVDAIKNGHTSWLIPQKHRYIFTIKDSLKMEKQLIEQAVKTFEKLYNALKKNEESTGLFVAPTYKKEFDLYHFQLNVPRKSQYYYLRAQGAINPQTLEKINKKLTKLAIQNNVYINVEDCYDPELEANFLKIKMRSSKRIEDLFGISLEKGYELERNTADSRKKKYIGKLNELTRNYIKFYEIDMAKSHDSDFIKNDAYMSLLMINDNFKDVANKEEILDELEFNLDNSNYMLTIGKESKIIRKKINTN